MEGKVRKTAGFLTEVVAHALEQLVCHVAIVSQVGQSLNFGFEDCGDFIVGQPRSPRCLVCLAVVVPMHFSKRMR
jgi:hypothetical protein